MPGLDSKASEPTPHSPKKAPPSPAYASDSLEYAPPANDPTWPQNGFELRGAVVVDSAVRPQNGFHQAMRPKKITMVLKMKESAENDLELNGTGEGTQVDIRRKELYSEATSGGNAAADMFDASAGGADDDDLYN
ncbi:hypothetical protein Tco_0983801 [Tanacetum coccineum]